MNVDLPQPDGPMIAVTSRAGIARSMPLRTSWLPNQARRLETLIFMSDSGTTAQGV